MRQKLLVAILVLITAAYCWGLGWIAWGFSRAGGTVGWGLALGVAILLALTVWVTWREVLFGMAAGRLAREYRPEAERDERTGPRSRAETGKRATPQQLAGDKQEIQEQTVAERRDREALPANRWEFETARAAIQEGGRDDWHAWFRLALAYDSLRDRRSARAATRRAIEARRQAPQPRSAPAEHP